MHVAEEREYAWQIGDELGQITLHDGAYVDSAQAPAYVWVEEIVYEGDTDDRGCENSGTQPVSRRSRGGLDEVTYSRPDPVKPMTINFLFKLICSPPKK